MFVRNSFLIFYLSVEILHEMFLSDNGYLKSRAWNESKAETDVFKHGPDFLSLINI